jgi:hypothetical protein
MIYLEKFAGVAQLVEQLICNQPVGSSSLSTSSVSVKSKKGLRWCRHLKPFFDRRWLKRVKQVV